MKKRSVYIIILSLFIVAIGLIIFKYTREQKREAAADYALQQRKGPLANSPEWASVQNRGSVLLEAVKTNPSDIKSSLALAALYIQEARVTGNYVYYDKAAMKYINDVLKLDSINFNALIYKSLIYISQHHFAEGLATAQRAQKLNPYNAFVYGIMVDGHVEMGDYTKAVENSDKMVSIRPDIRSYSRISYLREIHGDYPGAIEAMKMAVEAGAPGDEATEWARVHLGKLYENTGELKYAEMHYTIANDERPGYAYAIAGLARIAMASGNYQKAIGLYQHADSLLNDYSFKEDLVDVYRLTGQHNKAKVLADEVIEGLSKDAAAGETDDDIGHYADRELAHAYLKVNDYEKAWKHAMQEYNRRPENIDVNETVAWVLYSKGAYAEALPYVKVALRTNSKNPELLCRAGLIYAKAGDPVMAISTLKEALQKNPNISPALKAESTDVLKKLQIAHG